MIRVYLMEKCLYQRLLKRTNGKPIKCMSCPREIKVGQKVVSTDRGRGGSMDKIRLRHLECAERINLV